jgi:hypothetical protein
MEMEERADGDRMYIEMNGRAWMETECAYLFHALTFVEGGLKPCFDVRLRR